MLLAIIISIVVAVFAICLFKLKNITIKTFLISIFTITLIATIYLCISPQKMHNQFSLNIIDYLVKFNTDGSMTTTKQVSTEVLKEVKK